MSKKWTKILKLAFVITLFVIILNMTSNIYAAINTEYKIDSKVVDNELDKKAKSSILLDAIGNLIYVLASFGEWLIGVIFQAIASTGGATGDMTFPWADAIVFNAVEVLDINFLNASEGSVVALIKDVITRIYGTIFGVAISFFSIAVLIMGIKIAISTIASDKAKYKQALWDWLLGLVLLFTMHFFISFVFYLNEQLVKVASGIATESMEVAKYKENLLINEKNESAEENALEVMNNFIDQMMDSSWSDANPNSDFVLTTGDSVKYHNSAVWRVTPSMWKKNEAGEYIQKFDFGWETNAFLGDGSRRELNSIDILALEVLDSNFKEIENVNNYLKTGEAAKIGAKLFTNSTYMHLRMEHLTGDQSAEENKLGLKERWSKQSDKKYLKLLCFDIYNIENNNKDLYLLLANMSDKDIASDRKQFAKLMVQLIEEYEETNDINDAEDKDADSLLFNLASYFKENSWGIAGGGGWGTSKVVIQNAIMYAILVVQSFIFLIAYIKRLFYVVVLAMMAPAVVVYDFFNKSMS